MKALVSLRVIEKLTEAELPIRDQVISILTGFEDISRRFCCLRGVEFPADFRIFLKRSRSVKKEFEQLLADPDIGASDRCDLTFENWFLQAVHEGHAKVFEAVTLSRAGHHQNAALATGEAGVWFGRITMLFDLQQEGILDSIGPMMNQRIGSSKGGIKSAIARSRNSAIPSPLELREAKAELAKQGRPLHTHAAILAARFACTPDHIRKLLKRD